MNNFFIQFQPMIQAIGWTLLHSLWQGLLLYCALKIVLKAVPTSRASLRYNISLATFAALILWSVTTFYNQWQKAAASIVPLQLADIPTGSAINGPVVITENSNLLQQLMTVVDNNLNTIVQLYIIGVLLLIGRMTYNIYSLKRVKTYEAHSLTHQYEALLSKCIKTLNIKPNVLLSITEKVNVPMVIGTLKPVILLPLASVNNLTIEQTETILLHELAHIKRNDYLINMIQVIIETLFFYNPFVWLISKNIRIEREYCCDDIVTSNSGATIDYAHALAELSKLQASNKLSMAATGNNKYKLLNRIKRIIEMKKTPINKAQLTFVTILITALLLSVTMFSPTLLAQSRNDDDDNTLIKKDDKKPVNIQMVTEEVTIIDDDGKTTSYKSIEDIPQQHKKLLHDIGDNVMFGPNKKFITKSGDSFIVKMEINTDAPINDSTCINYDIIDDALIDSMVSSVTKQIIILTEDMADAKQQMAEARKQLADARKQMADARRKIVIETRDELRHKQDSLKQSIMIVRSIHDKQRATNYKHKSVTVRNLDGVINQLDQDGLIKKDKDYTIEIKDNELYINGKKKDRSVMNKYFSDEKDSKKFIIKSSNGNTNIEIRK